MPIYGGASLVARTFTKSSTSAATTAAAAAAAILPICPRHLGRGQQISAFSTTCAAQLTGLQKVEKKYAHVPPYPYAARQWYNKSNFGLYGTARVRFGNNVSGRTETRTRRRWYPNVQRKRLWSAALGRFVRVKVVARVLRSVDKVGGLDEYLLGEKAARVKELGPGGWALRWRVMRTPAVRERYRLQRETLGLPPMQPATAAAAAAAAATVLGRGGGEEILQVPEEDVGMTEEQLRARETAIDRALDEDDQRDARGEDGGVELESLGEAEEPDRSKPKRW